ncbi:MAG TPA: SpoIID/LytB domain-containing protein [Bdellovibrionota bacterium]|nr:SpoIID/LytB domain-containing protein [Bdellovibrionota bacterium]
MGKHIFTIATIISLISVPFARAQKVPAETIRLRVLLKKINQDEVLSIGGGKVFVGSDERATAPSLQCSYYSGLAQPLMWTNPLLQADRWHCKSTTQNLKVEAPIFVHAKGAALTLDGDAFRGHLELVPLKNQLLVINHVPIDAYLASLANSEMSASFPTEALKAQIIAARSYALSTALDRRQKRWPFDLYNTQFDQVYRGIRYETPKSWELARLTTRQVLNYKRNVLKAYYHSSSGGQLEVPLNVWSDSRLHAGAYRAKVNPYDKNIGSGIWQITLSRDLGKQIKASGPFRDIRVMERTEGKRVKRLRIVGDRGQTELSGVQFRNLFGSGWIKSALFDVKKQGSSFVIQGKGWGHGVGMSQWGAKVMADAGKSAEQILKFYYPGANVAIYGRAASSTPLSSARDHTHPAAR